MLIETRIGGETKETVTGGESEKLLTFVSAQIHPGFAISVTLYVPASGKVKEGSASALVSVMVPGTPKSQ